MQFDLSQAVAAIDRNQIFQIGNQARPAGNYLFNAILPEENRNSYEAKSGSMTIRATMAGLVGMDSPYPETGFAESEEFAKKVAKIANRSRLPEKLLRELQDLLLRLNGSGTTEAIQRTALNFLDKIIVQAHLDTMEWLRGQSLFTGKIDWTFGKIRLLVDYGIPTGNFLPARTGNDGYGGTTSKFWDDVRLMNRQQKGEVRARIMHPDTKEMILANEANNIKLLDENTTTGAFSIVKYRVVGGTVVESTDPRDRAQFITYGEEGEIYDQADATKTKIVPFCPRGAILTIGAYNGKRFTVGAGSTPPPTPVQLGITHIAPTVEGGGVAGRWTNVYTPQNEPWAIEARGVTNGLPLIEAADRLSVSTTQMV